MGSEALNLFRGMREAMKDKGARPDTVKAGGVSQLNPDARDQQVSRLAQQAPNVERWSTKDSDKVAAQKTRKTIELFARMASTIKTAENQTTAWREKKPNFDEEDGYQRGSKSRAEVITELVDALTENKSVLIHDVYGQEFCQDNGDSGYRLKNMEPHERRLLIQIAPTIITELRRQKETNQKPENEEYRARAEGILINKLKLIAEGNLVPNQVGKREYSSYSHEAMIALIKVEPELAVKTVSRFLKDTNVDVDDKIDVLNNYPIRDFKDVSQLINILANFDSEGLDNSDKITLAAIRRLKSQSTYGINDNTRVEYKHFIKPFGQFTKEEQREIISSHKRVSRGLLLQMGYNNNQKVAAEALTLIPDKLAGEYDRHDQPRIFSAYGTEIDSIQNMSATVMNALPDFVFGKSPISENHYTMRDASELRKLLAQADILKEPNFASQDARVFITQELFQGGMQLLKQLGTSHVKPAQVNAALDSMVTMYRKLDVDQREKVHLNDYDIKFALDKMPRHIKTAGFVRKLKKVGFNARGY